MGPASFAIPSRTNLSGGVAETVTRITRQGSASVAPSRRAPRRLFVSPHAI
jgi:hypothetical protein